MTKSEAIAELVRIWHSPHLDLSLKAGLAEAIEALKAKTDDDLISRAEAIDACCRGWNNAAEDCIRNIKALQSAEPPVLTCNGCRHVGTYDTDFPCSVCIRREKDYYEQER